MDPVIRNILDVAVAEFAEHGLAGARVDAIAARTRTSKRMLYYHFGSKEGLYAAALADAYAGVRTALEEPDYESLPPAAALGAYVGHLFDLHLKSPQFVRLVMGENLLGGRFIESAESVRQMSHRSLETLARIVQRGQRSGEFRGDLEPLDIYANIVGLSFHFVSNRQTFSALFEAGADVRLVSERRRAVVIDTIDRQIRTDTAAGLAYRLDAARGSDSSRSTRDVADYPAK